MNHFFGAGAALAAALALSFPPPAAAQAPPQQPIATSAPVRLAPGEWPQAR